MTSVLPKVCFEAAPNVAISLNSVMMDDSIRTQRVFSASVNASRQPQHEMNLFNFHSKYRSQFVNKIIRSGDTIISSGYEIAKLRRMLCVCLDVRHISHASHEFLRLVL